MVKVTPGTYTTKNCGKIVKNSKKKYSWTFKLDNQLFSIDFYNSKMSGKKKIVCNDMTIMDGSNVYGSQIGQSFSIQASGQAHVVKIMKMSSGYELVLNDVPFSNFSAGMETEGMNINQAAPSNLSGSVYDGKTELEQQMIMNRISQPTYSQGSYQVSKPSLASEYEAELGIGPAPAQQAHKDQQQHLVGARLQQQQVYEDEEIPPEVLAASLAAAGMDVPLELAGLAPKEVEVNVNGMSAEEIEEQRQMLAQFEEQKGGGKAKERPDFDEDSSDDDDFQAFYEEKNKQDEPKPKPQMKKEASENDPDWDAFNQAVKQDEKQKPVDKDIDMNAFSEGLDLGGDSGTQSAQPQPQTAADMFGEAKEEPKPQTAQALFGDDDDMVDTNPQQTFDDIFGESKPIAQPVQQQPMGYPAQGAPVYNQMQMPQQQQQFMTQAPMQQQQQMNQQNQQVNQFNTGVQQQNQQNPFDIFN